MFNDDVQMGFFDMYDQYMLNMLYDPRIRAGMSNDQVKEILPKILPDVRAWIAKVNDLKDWRTGNARTDQTTARKYRPERRRDVQSPTTRSATR